MAPNTNSDEVVMAQTTAEGQEKNVTEDESNEEIVDKTKKRKCQMGWGPVIDDIKRTLGTHYIAEMTNFNQKTIAVSFFLFFACIAPAITFGAIYEKATNGWIGAVEMILATAWVGIFYALLGGQPMMINGGTGPVLAFTEIIYKMSKSLDIPFLPFNAWIGIWVAAYMIIAAFTGMNRVIGFATRFTDEIFSFLIAMIFIINALGNPFSPTGLYYYFVPDHKSHEYHADNPDYSYLAAGLLSVIVCLGTVWFSFSLRKTKFSPFFYSQLGRNVVSDFAVVISIVLMTVVANVIFKSVPTETLNVPDKFSPTFSCCTASCTTAWPDYCPELSAPYRQRPWIVDLFDLNGKGWVPLMAAGPALLAFILVFLDDGITWHLINAPNHKLTHGDAYNYDTIIVGIAVAVNSILGLPWLVAATVRSLNHIHAMAEKSPSGKILNVQETRLTQLFIHLLCAVTIFALDLLKLIPVPVLYGVFLFMGLVSLGTNTFWVRMTMFFMQPSKFPPEPFTECMSAKRIHLFTAIQLALFALLYTVKAIKTIAIAFPIVIAACIPFRMYILPKIFTAKELVMLDGEDEAIKKWLQNEEDEMLKAEEIEDLEDQNDDKDKGDEEEDEEDDDEAEEERDTVAPLPLPKTFSKDFDKAPSKQKSRQRRRSTSAPQGYLFAEPPQVVIRKQAQPREFEDLDRSDLFADETASGSTDDAPIRNRRGRPRRVKQVSCPTHYLIHEAKKQVDTNYFFG